MTSPLIIGSLGWPELLLIVLVVLLLFGAKRIPELMKSIGSGVRNFKQGMKEIEREIDSTDKPEEKK